MATTDYAIGLSNPPTNLEELATPVNPPKGIFFEAAQWLDTADGQRRGQGFPTAEWLFMTLTQAMLDQLRIFCPGQSAPVYITTRALDGNFATYSAVMLWPSDQLRQRAGTNYTSDIYQNITFQFRRLQAV